MTRHLKTGIGVALTAIMLFPVYWMINVSFTRDTDMRASPPHLFPHDATLQDPAVQAGPVDQGIEHRLAEDLLDVTARR